ncbi:MAG TPA: ABC transporter substrate-binding protein, partial [Aestuariivirgaceae bacterium]|nr:ABC transporter substrate-binding protein [Aestuariivirgaceae bacterium]
MIRIGLVFLSAWLWALTTVTLPSVAVAGYVEAPGLEAKVAAGELPPVVDRLPRNPRVIDLAAMNREPGRHGGTIRMLMGGQNDIRLMTLFGYARFVGYDLAFELKPDILESFEVEEGRIFTLRLRDGHRWSDGHPFTTEDIRYTWEDVITNEELSPVGPDHEMLVDGEPPQFEVIDELTVRFTWSKPNPEFLPALAAPRPIFLAMPAHYLKGFHAKYQDSATLDKLVAEVNVSDWTRLHMRQARQYRPENPELPTLDPWRNSTEPPADQFVFVRNPFFHRVDAEGRQLPYVDRMVLTMGSTDLIPAKAGAGDADLQARYIRFDNYTFLKNAEERIGIKVHLWKSGGGSTVALLPNLNATDPVWRPLLRDARFRRALSLSIDRTELNQVVYFGLANESADTVLPESPLYREEYRTAWARHDPDAANALLDELGLEPGSDGIRRLPDGRLAELIVETSGEGTLETDMLELISDYWREVGLKLYIKVSQREVLRSRAVAGEVLVSVWSGLDNGVATADMNPAQLAPTAQSQLQWPMWGIHYETSGLKGEAPDLPEVARLLELLAEWRAALTPEERSAAWNEMLSIYADQVYSIGTINSTLQPVVVSGRLRNVPEKGIYAFEPGAYFGMYLMDTFWF